MTLPMNDDIVNCELSIEELDAIAAGRSPWSLIGDALKILGGPIVAILAAGDSRTGTGGGRVGGATPLRQF